MRRRALVAGVGQRDAAVSEPPRDLRRERGAPRIRRARQGAAEPCRSRRGFPSPTSPRRSRKRRARRRPRASPRSGAQRPGVCDLRRDLAQLPPGDRAREFRPRQDDDIVSRVLHHGRNALRIAIGVVGDRAPLPRSKSRRVLGVKAPEGASRRTILSAGFDGGAKGEVSSALAPSARIAAERTLSNISPPAPLLQRRAPAGRRCRR